MEMFMKYIVIPRPNEVLIMEGEMPERKKGEAILKLLYGGICGSDAGTYSGKFLYAKYPRIPGHEFSAEVVEVDEDNEYGIKKGMVVTCNPYFNCGTCYSCRRGLVNCCTSNETMGAQRDGAFRQYISMPLERIYDGHGISARTLAAIEPFSISYHAVKRAQIKAGEKVLVVGAGTIGYLAAVAASMRGCQVYVCDVAQEKLDYAKKLNIAGTILNESDEKFQKEVNAITHGDGFDVCIEAVGLPSTFENCIDAAAFRGRVVIIGIGKQSLDFFYSVIQTKELEIYGSRNAEKGDFLELIESVKLGKFDLDSIISAVYPFEAAAQAFEDFRLHNSNMMKVLLKFE